MKKFLTLAFLVPVYLLMAQIQTPANKFILVDQFGYLPKAKKVAVIRDPQIGFNAADSFNPSSTLKVFNSSNQEVFSGSVVAWNAGATDAPSGDKGWWFDFSSLETPGTYYIRDVANNHNSYTFKIGADVYNDVLKAATKMFYLQRCGVSKTSQYIDSKWTDGTSFSQDSNARSILDPNNSATQRDLSGGWYDAGDYNKYITFLYDTVHHLLAAYQYNPSVFTDSFNIPESNNNLPDLLDEIKFELDWMFKMTSVNGATIIKMGSQNYSENASSPPSSNTFPRYYGRVCTSSSATVASIFAHAALIFSQFPAFTTYANQLKQKAIDCFAYVLPRFNNNTLDTNCDNGEIVAGDADMTASKQKEVMLSAAVYLFALTNDSQYNTFLTTNTSGTAPVFAGTFDPNQVVINDAYLYYTTLANANISLKNSILTKINTDVNNNWNSYYGVSQTNYGLYRNFMNDWSYHWGSNMPKAKYGILNIMIGRKNIGTTPMNGYLRGEEYIHSFHGVNALSMTMLTNMYSYGADNCANEMYHTWFNNGTDFDNALTSLKGPAPGFVVGGPNKDFSVTTLSPPTGQPIAKAYRDFNDGFPNNSWELSEPAIYYQAVYIRLLSDVIARNLSLLSNESFNQLNESSINLYPNPAKSILTIETDLSFENGTIINLQGQKIYSFNNAKTVDLTSLQNGIYLVKMNVGSKEITKKFIKE